MYTVPGTCTVQYGTVHVYMYNMFIMGTAAAPNLARGAVRIGNQKQLIGKILGFRRRPAPTCAAPAACAEAAPSETAQSAEPLAPPRRTSKTPEWVDRLSRPRGWPVTGRRPAGDRPVGLRAIGGL